MPTATATPTAPLRLREPTSRSRHEPRDHAAVSGIRTESHAAFEAFVTANRFRFADYVAGRLRGHHASAAEDALQHGLLDIWKEFDRWPTDEQERQRFATQALKTAALEAIRKRTGRDGSPRAGEVVVDFADLDGRANPAPGADQLARDLGREIAAQSMVKDQLAYLEKASLVAAIATLTELEQRVLFKTAQGDDCKEIAADLGVTHQQAREALMRARRLCRMLIEHADGQKVTPQEAKLLWQYRDGRLSGKRARELRRHVDHCTACQRLLGLEESIGTNGALVILPIPLLLLATGKTLAGGSTAAAASVSSAGGAAAGTGSGIVGAQVGGTVLTATPTAWTGSVLAGVTAKAGLALAGLAVAGSFAGVYKLAHDRQAERRAAAIAAGTPATPTVEMHDALAPRVSSPVRVTPKKPVATPSKRTTARRATKRRTPRKVTPSAAPPASATTTQIRATTATARPPAITPQRAAPARRTTTAKRGSASLGGQFVIGGR